MTWLSDEISQAWGWFTDHPAFGWWLAGLSFVASVGGIFLVRWLMLTIPHDYFNRTRPVAGWRDRHPVVRWTLLIGKNAAGAVLLLLGLTMLITPGPGIVTLLIALILLDIPGKRRLEHWIVGLPTVLDVINRVRRRADRPAVEAPAQRSR